MSAHPSTEPLVNLLHQQLVEARSTDAEIRAQHQQGDPLRVPGLGKGISVAYEQLRNAAEYTEEHLLLERAIRRFYKRNLMFATQRHIGTIGDELVVELTQAGYLQRDSFSSHTTHTIRQIVTHYMAAYWSMREHGVARDIATEWTLDIISVETESFLNPHNHLYALTFVGYQHYLQLLPKNDFLDKSDDPTRYEISLYIATHQALIKSDIAIIRHDLLKKYSQTPDDITSFVQFNTLVDDLYTAPLTQRIKRGVNKYGAPLRILKSLVQDHPEAPELLADRDNFLTAYDQQTNKEYQQIAKRLNKGIIKSIIFVLITKVLIGIAIEIPYDIWVVGHIALVPLCINLLFPPLYMASLKLGLHTPSFGNAQAMRDYIDLVLFAGKRPLIPHIRHASARVSLWKKLLYAVLFFVPFAVTVYVLSLVSFNWVQMVIFFTFLSTASFLGFRLSRLVRELELVSKQATFFIAIRDFFYLPFILVGQWISSKYAKVNAVAYFLDIAIELPLKTVLRLIRQWTRFLNEKHDEIY